jgi:D-serine deaminase-like pyridoxal phosphate-dependent protein
VIESSSLELGIGDKVEVIPNHACTVMNLFDEYYLVEDGLVLGRIPITARGHRHLV